MIIDTTAAARRADPERARQWLADQRVFISSAMGDTAEERQRVAAAVEEEGALALRQGLPTVPVRKRGGGNCRRRIDITAAVATVPLALVVAESRSGSPKTAPRVPSHANSAAGVRFDQ